MFSFVCDSIFCKKTLSEPSPRKQWLMLHSFGMLSMMIPQGMKKLLHFFTFFIEICTHIRITDMGKRRATKSLFTILSLFISFSYLQGGKHGGDSHCLFMSSLNFALGLALSLTCHSDTHLFVAQNHCSHQRHREPQKTVLQFSCTKITLTQFNGLCANKPLLCFGLKMWAWWDCSPRAGRLEPFFKYKAMSHLVPLGTMLC